MDIVTGFRNEPHITSEQDRMFNRAIFGEDSVVLSNGNRLVAELISNNEIHVLDGAICQQGCFGVIPRNTYDLLTIENGTQGMNRKDLIVSRYTKDPETNIESMELVVVKGEESESSAVIPEYTTGSLADGDLLDEFPLYVINIDGIQITSIERFSGTSPISDLSNVVFWQ